MPSDLDGCEFSQFSELTFWSVAFDLERFVIGLPEAGSRSVPPWARVGLYALRIAIVTNSSDKLAQLWTNHPQAQIVLLLNR